ncbi:LuxR C-terminal-related transcriptional regulator [Microbacterium sp. BWT-B31]|uniref:helix-turn-helix transcriptional regulator n=1 Tax=Microbacterium sp. BWT-B31 TaxID=3232072 RepID=UPI0035276760
MSLASGISSRQAFWQHVVRTLVRAGDLPPDVAARVENQHAESADPVRVSAALLSDRGVVTLVLDSYEHLADAIAQVDEDLLRLLETVPTLRLVVAARGNTAVAGFNSPDGRAGRVVTSRELALTAHEIRTLLHEQAGIDDESLADTVLAVTGGFALTVRAVVLAVAQLGDIPSLGSMDWDSIVTSRLESLLPNADAVRFVTDTSVPPYFDVGAAQQLSGHPDPEPLLRMLERNGFGRWIPFSTSCRVFQYVGTFRQAFRTRAREDLDRFRRLCVLGATWLLAHGEIDQALQLALEGEDYGFANRIFASLMIQDPDGCVSDRFLPVLRTVPEEILADYPVLALGLGLALQSNPLLRPEAPSVFRVVIDSTEFPPHISPEVDAFSLLVMKAVASRIAYAFPESAQTALDALRALEAVPADLVTANQEHVGVALRQLSFSLMQKGRIEDAVVTATRAVAVSTSPMARNYATVYAAGASAFAGDMVRAQAFMASIDADADSVSLRRSSMSAMGMVAEGYRLLDALEFQNAADKLLDTDANTSTSEFWPFFTAISVSARTGLGQGVAEAERVAAELAGQRPPGIGDNVATDHLHAVLGRAFLAAGDRRAAAGVLDSRPPDRAHLAPARIVRLLVDDRVEDALTLAIAALDLPDHTLRTRADTRTVGAVAALRCGDRELAWEWVNAAAATWETSGPRQHVALLTAADRRLLDELAVEKASRAVAAYLDVPAPPEPSQSVVSSPLTPRERVVLRALDTHGSVREVAEALIVSPHTVKSQLQSIYRKLRVSSRHGAVAVARQHGLLEEAAER